MKCRCGHGRSWHHRAARLSGWERGRGASRPRRNAWMPCQWTGGCPCRNWHPVEPVR